MNAKRKLHGIGILPLGVSTVGNKDKIIVFGGKEDDDSVFDSIEVYDEYNQQWELLTNTKLAQAKHGFGFLSIKSSDIQ